LALLGAVTNTLRATPEPLMLPTPGAPLRQWAPVRHPHSDPPAAPSRRESPTGPRQRAKSDFQVVRVAQSGDGAVQRYRRGGILHWQSP
jgi:hypothetical protein